MRIFVVINDFKENMSAEDVEMVDKELVRQWIELLFRWVYSKLPKRLGEEFE